MLIPTISLIHLKTIQTWYLFNMEGKKILYTFGYTLFQKGREIDTDLLFRTLQDFHISYLIDIRSVPYSKQYPQCNAEALRLLGRRYGIPYGHMPELGAKASPTQNVYSKASDIFFDDIFPIAMSNRPDKSQLYAYEEIVDFQKFRNDEFFTSGLKRVENAYSKGFTLALMCSEKYPISCHRYFLVSKSIEQKYGDWISVEHITQDANNGLLTTLPNKKLDKQLADLILNKKEVKGLDLLSSSFFGSSKLDKYYGNTQEEKIADFCDRYWNLMHGWKRMSSAIIND